MTMPAEVMDPPEPADDCICTYCEEAHPADRMLAVTDSDAPICPDCASTCEDCGAIVENDDANSVGGQIFCSDCVFYCADCQRPQSRDMVAYYVRGSQRICERCFCDGYFECPDCDYVDTWDSGITSDHDDCTRCESCHDRHVSDRDDEKENIGQYHSSRGIVVPITSPASTAANGLFFGVELEVERATNAIDSADDIAGTIADYVAEDRDNITEGRNTNLPVLCFEEDGSLSDGFEMVSAPLGIDDQRRLWSRVLSCPVIRQLRSHDTTTCGLHIHLTRRALTTIQIAKIVTFVNDPDNETLIRAIARRYDGGFCHIKAKRLATAHNPEDSRYQAVNLWNSRTIELRIFKGSLKLSAVLAALDFANALVRFTATCSGSGFNLKTAAFLSFISSASMRSDTKHLRAYLAQRLPSCQEKN